MTRRAGLLLAGLFLASFAFRPQLVGIGPLLPAIQADLDVPHAVAGLLATILVASLGLFAPLGFRLARRIGVRRALAASLAAIGVFGVARAVVPGAPALLLLTVPVGVGMGIGNGLLPIAVRAAFADRTIFATGIYATGINGGAAAAAASAVPLAHLAWGWELPLVVFSGASLLGLVAWLALTREERPHAAPAASASTVDWGNRAGWALGGVFGIMSILYYGLNSWLAASYVERGWSAASAGALITVLNVTTIPTGLLLAVAGDRFGSRRTHMVGAAAAELAAVLGVVLVPGGAWAWAALAGGAIGVLFPSAMTLPLDVARRPGELASVAGVMLVVGYSVSALAPFALGAVRDATGSFTTALWLIAGDGALFLVVCSLLSRERLRRASGAGGA